MYIYVPEHCERESQQSIKVNCDGYINCPPFESFTIELGAQEQIDAKKAREQANKILGYLKTKGVCDVWVDDEVKAHSNISAISNSATTYSCKLENLITIYANAGGMILDHAPLGITAKTGTPLTTISNPATFEKIENLTNLIDNSNINISLNEDCIPLTRISTANVHEGMALIKVMTKYRHRLPQN